MSRRSCVGTSETYRRGAVSRAVASANAAEVNGPSGSTSGAVPASSDRTSTCSPATCVGGSASSHVPLPTRAAVAAAEARRFAAVSRTPFGSPVEPEVGTTSATSSCSSGSSGRSAATPGTSGTTAGPVPSSAAASAGSSLGGVRRDDQQH